MNPESGSTRHGVSTQYAAVSTPYNVSTPHDLSAQPDVSAQFDLSSPHDVGALYDVSVRRPVRASQQPEAAPGAGSQVFTRLLNERIILLGSEVRDDNSNEICAALLLLAAQSTDDISLYINSPGGSVTAGMAVYDTMQFVKCDVSTVAMGLAGSMGQFLLSAGTPGKRLALPHARIMMHQPSGGFGGSATDIRIQAEQMMLVKRQLAELTAAHTGQSLAQIEEDSDRDRWFTATEAADYGLIDRVTTRAELRTPAQTSP